MEKHAPGAQAPQTAVPTVCGSVLAENNQIKQPPVASLASFPLNPLPENAKWVSWMMECLMPARLPEIAADTAHGHYRVTVAHANSSFHSYSGNLFKDHPKKWSDSDLNRGVILSQGFIYMEIRRRGISKGGLERKVVSHQGELSSQVLL